MTKNLTVNELNELIENELVALSMRTMDKSNRLDAMKKMRLVGQLVESLASDTVVENIEGCWKDGGIREGYLFNAGSIVEAIVRYHEGKRCEKTASGRDCGRYEVKASLTAKSLCTAPTQATCTIVVNTLGAWKCYKKDFPMYLTAKKGTRFPHNAPCGVYMAELSELMGFDPIED